MNKQAEAEMITQVSATVSKLTKMYPGQAITFIQQEKGLMIGVLAIEPEPLDWFYTPAPVEKVTALTDSE